MQKVVDLLSIFQYNEAWKYLQLNGIINYMDADIIAQMKRKHPSNPSHQ